MQNLSLDAASIKRRLVDPVAVAHALGLADGARRQSTGLMVRCAWHAERTPSLSLTVGPDRTLRAHCFACGQGGDVFSLAATALKLDVRTDFACVVRELAARCCPDVAAPLPTIRKAPPSRLYPPDAAIVWERCGKLYDDRQLREQLRGRSIDPAAVTAADLARALPAGLLPRWCGSWQRSGHRCVVPLYDVSGNLASLHGRTLTPGLQEGQSKGRFPTGYASRALIMADSTARDVLATGTAPWWNGEVHIAEGATDFLSLASRWSDGAEKLPATFGVYQGAWCGAIGARIPDAAVVRIMTHPDDTGREYARMIKSTLGHCRALAINVRTPVQEGRSHG